ncbi:MAG: hypothetical protein HY815_23555 [Candidatus Riflebacteria bacterium]|nr:hypothetical protein [Candidatus Riflebacteria bacterium]
MMKCAAFLVLWLLAGSPSAAMETPKFKQLMAGIEKGQFATVEKYLVDNRAAMKGDPEYFVVLLNFVLSKGRSSSLAIANGKPGAGDYGLSQNGKTIGFLGARESYDESLISDGIARARAALPAFKARLDIHLGILAAAEMIKRWRALRVMEVEKPLLIRYRWGTGGQSPPRSGAARSRAGGRTG